MAQGRIKALWPLCLGVFAGLCGCQFNPYAEFFVNKDVPENTVLGSYHITEETLTHFAKKEMPLLEGGHLALSRDAKITLDKDHMISLRQVPIDLGGSHACLLNASGTWKVIKYQKSTAVGVRLTHLHALAPRCPEGEFGFDLELFDDSALRSHTATKYPLLHLTMGDPDSGDALQFEKD